MGEFGNSVENIRRGIESNRRKATFKKKYKILQPLKAIRLKCLECTSNSAAEIQRCHDEKCALWPFRFGYYPDENDLIVPEFNSSGEKTGEHFYRAWHRVGFIREGNCFS